MAVYGTRAVYGPGRANSKRGLVARNVPKGAAWGWHRKFDPNFNPAGSPFASRDNYRASYGHNYRQRHPWREVGPQRHFPEDGASVDPGFHRALPGIQAAQVQAEAARAALTPGAAVGANAKNMVAGQLSALQQRLSAADRYALLQRRRVRSGRRSGNRFQALG